MFPWPGNIRQLENVLQQAILISTGSALQLRHLPQPVRDHGLRKTDSGSSSSDFLSQKRALAERSQVHRALLQHRFNRARAAASLGISRMTLYKKMKKYGLVHAEGTGRHHLPGS
jgi:transcriptional regulator with PAS, ATPase and Fis domain